MYVGVAVKATCTRVLFTDVSLSEQYPGDYINGLGVCIHVNVISLVCEKS